MPVIAKADTLTTHEVKKLKERILADIEEHEIQVLLLSYLKVILTISSSVEGNYCLLFIIHLSIFLTFSY